MASYLANKHNIKISIPQVETAGGFTVYKIAVDVAGVVWHVPHRYKDFLELHEQLVTEHGVTKDILPPKKLIGNQDPVFIEKRRAGLEVYLATVVSLLRSTMPRELALFLDLNHYEILFILQDMARHFFLDGDHLLQASKSYNFKPLQLHAISERLKQPCPPQEMDMYDFSHVLDFCCQLTGLSIHGNNSPVGPSNIIPNQLLFELSAFKAVENLLIVALPVSNIYSLGSLRETVVSLIVHYSHLERLSHFLLCDDIHKDSCSYSKSQVWKKVVLADFSNNEISEIDTAIQLIPNVENLVMNNNKLSSMDNLTSLPHLSQLHLSANCFVDVDNLHTKMGNIVNLDLSQNAITSLVGFSKLYSLEVLDLGSNQVTDLNEVSHVCNLPCLESFVLTGNPVATVVDYRVKVLEQFGKRAICIILDNEKSTQKELDTVSVLQALRLVKEGRTPNFRSEIHTNI